MGIPTKIYQQFRLARLFRSSFCTQILSDAKNLDAVLSTCEKSVELYTADWQPGFSGLVGLLLPGLLSKDGEISGSTREVLQILSGAKNNGKGNVMDER